MRPTHRRALRIRAAKAPRVRGPRRNAQPQEQKPRLALGSTRRIPRRASLGSAVLDASTSAGRRNHCAFRDHRRRSFATSSGHADIIGRWFLFVCCRKATCGAGEGATGRHALGWLPIPPSVSPTVVSSTATRPAAWGIVDLRYGSHIRQWRRFLRHHRRRLDREQLCDNVCQGNADCS
jgi:hypothetical protein